MRWQTRAVIASTVLRPEDLREPHYAPRPEHARVRAHVDHARRLVLVRDLDGNVCDWASHGSLDDDVTTIGEVVLALTSEPAGRLVSDRRRAEHRLGLAPRSLHDAWGRVDVQVHSRDPRTAGGQLVSRLRALYPPATPDVSATADRMLTAWELDLRPREDEDAVQRWERVSWLARHVEAEPLLRLSADESIRARAVAASRAMADAYGAYMSVVR